MFVRYPFSTIEFIQCDIWEATLDTKWMRSYIMDILTEVRELDDFYYQNVITPKKITVSQTLNDFAGTCSSGVPDCNAQSNNADLLLNDVPILERDYKYMDIGNDILFLCNWDFSLITSIIDIPLTDENHEYDKLSQSPEKDVVAANSLFFDNKDTVKLTAMTFDDVGCSTVYLDSEKSEDGINSFIFRYAFDTGLLSNW